MDGVLSDIISLHRELITDIAIIIISQELVPEKTYLLQIRVVNDKLI